MSVDEMKKQPIRLVVVQSSVKIKKQIHSGYDWTKVYFYAGLFQLYFVYYRLSYYELNCENISDACIIIV